MIDAIYLNFSCHSSLCCYLKLVKGKQLLCKLLFNCPQRFPIKDWLLQKRFSLKAHSKSLFNCKTRKHLHGWQRMQK